MLKIDYTISSGAFPVTVNLVGGVSLNNIHYSPESGYFEGLPEENYEIIFIDNDNCTESELIQWPPTTTTTTTIQDVIYTHINYGSVGSTDYTFTCEFLTTPYPQYGNFYTYSSQGEVPTVGMTLYTTNNDGILVGIITTVQIGAQSVISWKGEQRYTVVWGNGDGTLTEVELCGEPFITEPSYYGLLYNVYSVLDARNIANTGWHVPSRDEQNTLVNYVGTTPGGKLKDFLFWNNPNTGALNSFGFSARGGGWRSISGGFSQLGVHGGILSTTGDTYLGMFNDSSNASAFYSFFNSNEGFSVRLIKDSTLLSHGEIGTYIGNDGKVYKTICIDTQEWTVDNLAETKYRDGSDIPIIEDDTLWGSTINGAASAYNNDYDNVPMIYPIITTTSTTTIGD